MTLEQKFNALAAYVLADSPEEKETTRKALNVAMRMPAESAIAGTTDIEDVIHQYLMEMTADPSLIGYKYIVYGIQQIIEHPNLLENITYGFYPLVAVKFDTSAARVERAIRNSIEKMFDTCPISTAERNYGYTWNMNSGKPANSKFLSRSVLNVKARLKK